MQPNFRVVDITRLPPENYRSIRLSIQSILNLPGNAMTVHTPSKSTIVKFQVLDEIENTLSKKHATRSDPIDSTPNVLHGSQSSASSVLSLER
jgi:hypothetical protein